VLISSGQKTGGLKGGDGRGRPDVFYGGAVSNQSKGATVVGGKKKNKRVSSKKRQKTKIRKPWKRTRLRIGPEESFPDSELTELRAMGEMNAPDGFRLVSTSQAIMEYASPIMEMNDVDELDQLNERLQLVSMLWNYSIAISDGQTEGTSKTDLIKSVKTVCHKSDKDAREFAEMMVARREYLFPEDLQVRGTPFMVMRKEVSVLIAPFDPSRLNLSSTPVPPSDEDRALVEKIDKLDLHMHKRSDYDAYEELLMSMQGECTERFGSWLAAKGAGEYRNELVWYPETFSTFVYGYLHEDALVFKSIPPIYLEEFFGDFVLRKLVIPPHQYAYIPASIKLFYQFLTDKGYMKDPTGIIEVIDEIETVFIGTLRERFS
jgi:hypothetical protein